jgi:hypothetical protein
VRVRQRRGGWTSAQHHAALYYTGCTSGVNVCGTSEQRRVCSRAGPKQQGPGVGWGILGSQEGKGSVAHVAPSSQQRNSLRAPSQLPQSCLPPVLPPTAPSLFARFPFSTLRLLATTKSLLPRAIILSSISPAALLFCLLFSSTLASLQSLSLQRRASFILSLCCLRPRHPPNFSSPLTFVAHCTRAGRVGRPSNCAAHSLLCTALSLCSHGICKTPIVSGFPTVVFTLGPRA